MAFVRPATRFVARSAELLRLAELTGEAAAGNAAAVLLSGDAGVGKTSLITEAARRAAADGSLVLLGRCVDLGTGALPYLPFAEALSQLVRAGEGEPEAGRPAAAAAAIVRAVAAERPELGRIAGAAGGERPVGGPGDAGLERLALFEAVTHTLGRLGDEVAPVLLVLEDLHWADPATRDLVRFLLARLGTERLLVIASYRGDDLHRRHPLRPLLAELLRLPGVERMELRPFDDRELTDFLTAVRGGRVTASQLRRIAARSAGNAYYAEELLAAGDDEELPAALADVLLDRIERLAPATQQLLKLASVMGNARIKDSVLRPVALATVGHDGPDAADVVETALREAVAHQALVPDDPDRYAFRHALLQEAVYADLLPGERVRLHAAVARYLVAHSSHDMAAAQLARHAFASHDLPTALGASLQAGREATRRSAPAQALEHYEQALQLWDAVPPTARPQARDEVEIGLAAATAASNAGLHDRALHLGRAAVTEALAQPGRPRVADARVALAHYSYAVDRALEARELARRVIADLAAAGLEPPQPAGVLARAMEIRVDLSFSEPEAALEVLPLALAEAEELGLAGVQAELLTSLATAEGMIGRPDVEKQLLAARAAAERSGDRATLVRVIYNIALDRIDLGDLAGGAVALQEGIDVADASGLTGSLYGAQCRSLLITTRWHLGDAEGALSVVEPDRMLPAALARFLRLFALPVQAARGPQDALAAADSLVVADAPWDNQILSMGRAEALAWLSRGREAAEAAGKALRYLDVANEPYMLAGVAMGTTAVAALADVAARARERGDAEGERAAIAAARPFLADARLRGQRGRPRRFTMGPEGLAWLARLEAEAARLFGDGPMEDDGSSPSEGGRGSGVGGASDVERWGAVAEAFAGVSVYEHARARWRHAQALARAGDRTGAAVQAAAARAAATRLGAAPLLAALDELVRSARLEVRLSSSRIDPHDATGGLTPREREVMGLVAAGLTNRAIGERLFISEKTASVHISNVLAKLGASGRAEAVAILGRRGRLAADPT